MAANLMKNLCSIAIVLLYIAPHAAWAQSLPDPTRPPPGIDGSVPISDLTVYPKVRGLQSVIISPAHCAAIIDGKTVELGAIHGKEKLIEVTEQGVVLQGEHGRRSLTLFPAVGIKITEALPSDKRAIKCQIDRIKHVKNPAKQDQAKQDVEKEKK